MDNQQAVWDQRYNLRKNKHTRLVAEGDSWFAYPVWKNMVDFVDMSDRFAICRRGESGRLLRQIVDDGLYLDAVRTEKPKALLISGSGNDFVNARFVTGTDGDGPIFNEYVAGMTADDLVSEKKWQSKLDELASLFEKIIERTDPAIPVVTHGYDYIIPSNEPAKYDGVHVGGPWIQPTMVIQKIKDETLQREIATLLIDSLNDMIAGIAAHSGGRFIHVDLRGTLGEKQDWANEIHPYSPGFKRLAAKYLDAVDAALASPPSPVLAAGGGQ